jgi:hypothetical protein
MSRPWADMAVSVNYPIVAARDITALDPVQLGVPAPLLLGEIGVGEA